MSTQATSVTESSSAEPNLTGHSYDGIVEYDNPLPGWWKFLFGFFVFISPIYYFYMHSGMEGRSIHDEYNAHMASVFQIRFAEIGELTGDRETLLEYMNEKPDWLKVGEVAYQTNCVSCHKADGGGSVGPNLTDDNWLHVNSIEDIVSVIEKGAANGAMPAWGARFSHPNQIVLISAYVASLRKNPVSTGKIAEGNKIPAWEE